MAVEEPKYSVETQSEHYEIRKYDAVIVAETEVQSSFEDAGNIAFKILAEYIFGHNSAKSKIAMTAPVVQLPTTSQSIFFTSPLQVAGAGPYLVQFTMPAGSTLENLPVPANPLVHLRALPARKIAVYSYTGSWSEEKFNIKLAEFLSELSRKQVATIGPPLFARFNSPYQLWFLRRNEIWIELPRD